MSERRAAWKRLLTDAPIFIALVALAGLLWRWPLVLALLYLGFSLLLLGTRWSPRTLAYYLVGFVLGPSGEYFAVHNGAWSYSQVAAALPLWLPLAWGIAGIYLHCAGEALAVLLAGRVTGEARPAAGGTDRRPQAPPRDARSPARR